MPTLIHLLYHWKEKKIISKDHQYNTVPKAAAMLLNSLYFSGSVGPLVSVQHDGDPDEVIVGGWQIEVLRRTLIPCRRNKDWIPC